MSSLSNFAFNCVTHYSRYDSTENYHVLNVEDIPDFEQEQFASLIISSDFDRANCSTGDDNSMFQKSMLPSLINTLRKPLDRDATIDFVETWKKGVVEYLKPRMQELIDLALFDYNDSLNFINPLIRHEREEMIACNL